MENKYLYYLTINVTNRCNLFCGHCYSNSGRCLEKDLEFGLIKKVLDDAKKLGLASVLITGGEPLLRKDLKDILKYCKSLKIKVFLATNGTLIKKENLLFIKKYVDKINVSIDGLPVFHDRIRGKKGVFNKTIKKIKEILKENIPLSISFTANNENYHQLKEVVEYLNKNKILKKASLNIKRCINIGRSKDKNLGLSRVNYFKLVELVNEVKKNGVNISFKDPFYSIKFGGGYGCFAGKHILSIKNNGDVWICTKLDKSIGNVKENSLLFIWDNSKILKEIRKDSSNKGCRAVAYSLTGDYNAIGPLFNEDSSQ